MRNFIHGKRFLLGTVHRLGVKRTLDTEIFLILPSVYGRRGLMTLALLKFNCTCFTLTFGHVLAMTKTYKAIINISTKQTDNIFQKLICKQKFIKLLKLLAVLPVILSLPTFHWGIIWLCQTQNMLQAWQDNNPVPQIGTVHRHSLWTIREPKENNCLSSGFDEEEEVLYRSYL